MIHSNFHLMVSTLDLQFICIIKQSYSIVPKYDDKITQNLWNNLEKREDAIGKLVCQSRETSGEEGFAGVLETETRLQYPYLYHLPSGLYS